MLRSVLSLTCLTDARRRAVEEEFEKAIDQAKNVGLSNDEILEIVTLLLDEA